MMRGSWDPGWFGGWERHMDGYSITGMVLMIVLWVVVIAALVIGIRAILAHTRRRQAAPSDTDVYASTAAATGPGTTQIPSAATRDATRSSLLDVLEERYAKGEIDRDEFLQRKQDLGLT